MKTRTFAVALVALAAASCTSTGAVDPNLAQRIAADVTCLNALAKSGLTVQGQIPSTGKPSAVQVLSTIETIGESNVPTDVLTACATTLQNAVAGAQGVVARAKAKTAAPAAPAK